MLLYVYRPQTAPTCDPDHSRIVLQRPVDEGFDESLAFGWRVFESACAEDPLAQDLLGADKPHSLDAAERQPGNVLRSQCRPLQHQGRGGGILHLGDDPLAKLWLHGSVMVEERPKDR